MLVSDTSICDDYTYVSVSVKDTCFKSLLLLQIYFFLEELHQTLFIAACLAYMCTVQVYSICVLK